jgi:hypothetical protein
VGLTCASAWLPTVTTVVQGSAMSSPSIEAGEVGRDGELLHMQALQGTAAGHGRRGVAALRSTGIVLGKVLVIAGSGLCMAIAVAARWAVGHFDPGGVGPNPEHYLAPPFILLFFLAVFAALGILVAGVAASVNQRRSRRQPPQPGPGGRALDGERPGGTGHRPVSPGRRTGKNRVDLRAHLRRRSVQLDAFVYPLGMVRVSFARLAAVAGRN